MSLTPSPNLFGRAEQVGQFTSQLQEHIMAQRAVRFGYYGIGGIGKTRLLTELAEVSRKATPYVVSLNCDPATPNAITDPLTALQAIVAQLEATGQTRSKRAWGLWGVTDPLAECKQLLGLPANVTIQNVIQASGGSTVSHNVQGGPGVALSGLTNIPAATQTLKQALPKLPTPVRLFRASKTDKKHLRPLVVLLVDTLEYASEGLKNWLREWLMGGTSSYSVLICAGRDQERLLLDTELPPLPRDDVLGWLVQAEVDVDAWLPAIYQATGGVPLLVQIAVELAQTDSGLTPAQFDKLAEQPKEPTLAFLFERYLNRLADQASRSPDPHHCHQLKRERYLLYHGAPLRVYEPTDLLRAVFTALPGQEEAFTEQTDYAEVLRHFKQHSFITPTGQLHRLLRDQALAWLRRDDPAIFHQVNHRAAEYYQQRQQPAGYFYHRLLAGDAPAFTDYAAAIETALAGGHLAEAAALFQVERELPFSPPQQERLTLLKAVLALSEGNMAKAAERLERLAHWPGLPDDLLPQTLARLAEFTADQPTAPRQTILPAMIRYRLRLWLIPLQPAIMADVDPQQFRADTLYKMGEVALRQARSDEAAAYYQAALKLSEAVGDQVGQANALRGLGEVARRQARSDEAAAYYQAALKLHEAVGDQGGQANARLGLGEVALMQARYDEAAAYYQAALKLHEAVGDQGGQAYALRGLGEVALMQARSDEAAAYYQAALKLSEAVGDQGGQANALRGLGHVALMQARSDEAAAYYQAALKLHEAVGDQGGQANALGGLGEVARRQARSDEAAAYYQAALKLHEAVGDQLGQANARLGLGEVALMQARSDEAAAYYQAALKLHEAVGDQGGQAYALRGLGHVALMQARSDEAAAYYQAALKLHEAVGDQGGQANALGGLGEVARRQARSDEAAAYYQAALKLHEAVGDQLGQAYALLGLGRLHHAQADVTGAVDSLRQLARLVHNSGLKQLPGMHHNIRVLAHNIGPAVSYNEDSGEISYIPLD